MNQAKHQQKIERLAKANQLLEAIASCGRKFFRHGDAVSTLEIAPNGKIWFIDSYTKKRVYTHYSGEWRGFTNGGTLRDLIRALRDYILDGKFRAGNLGPWPSWICNGDLWGYGDDMEQVRAKAKELGMIK